MTSISVITLVHGRQQHLKNMICGLSASSHLPSELVVVHMNEESDYSLPDTLFPVRRMSVTSSGTKIPLAAARNRGAEVAQGDLLIFLDVDCIPDSGLVDNYQQGMVDFDGLLMGDIRYLPAEGLSDDWTIDELRTIGVVHPSRPTVSALVEPTDRYELFWSLTFAISPASFTRMGGFDNQYQGYGAEDTDFAFTAREYSIPFALSRTLCYHQHHPVYRPPLQHFRDIIANARRFHTKWNRWAMESWLAEFAQRGYIAWDQSSYAIEIIREPTTAEIKSAYHEAPAGF